MKLYFALLTTAVLLISAAQGSVTINTGAVGILNDSVGDMISLGSIGILVADTDNNNLVDPLGTILGVGNSLGGASGDLILGVYQAMDLGKNQNGFDLSATIFSYSGAFEAGDSLYFVWFPSVETLNATIGAGISYGTFRTDSVDLTFGGTMAWTAPADGTNQRLFSLDSVLGGSPAIDPALFTASQITAVPEPATCSLFGIAALSGILLRRRFRRRPHCEDLR